MYAGLVFIFSFFQVESPRYLIKSGRRERALSSMSRLRHLPPTDPYVTNEIRAIEAQWQEEQESTKGQGALGIFKELFLIPSNFYRLYIGVAGQLLAQWSGAGSITIYAVDFFSLVGVNGRNESLLVTAIFGIVKLIAAMVCMLFLVDVVGRKRSLLLGIALQAISMIYVASFLTSVPQLGVDDNFVLPGSKKGASMAAIVMIYLSGFGWALGKSTQLIESLGLEVTNRNRVEQHAIPLDGRAISAPHPCAQHFDYNVRSFRQPVRQFPRCSQYAVAKISRWH
jgi:hypothetical protein